MKTLSILFLTIILSFNLGAQPGYEAAMGETMEKFSSSFSVSDLQATAAQFERIAEMQTDQWLPSYYASLIYSIMAFRTQDPEYMQQLINQAQVQCDKAIAIAPEESELHTLQGMIYQANIMVDPAMNGQVYGAKSNGSFQTAIKLDPANPRPYYLQAQALMYTPEEYGGGSAAALPLLEKAMELFNNFQVRGPFLPDWGKGECEQILKNCGRLPDKQPANSILLKGSQQTASPPANPG